MHGYDFIIDHKIVSESEYYGHVIFSLNSKDLASVSLFVDGYVLGYYFGEDYSINDAGRPSVMTDRPRQLITAEYVTDTITECKKLIMERLILNNFEL